MRPSVAISFTLLAVFLAVTPSNAARTCNARCAGPIAPAQYRFHWGLKLTSAFSRATFDKFTAVMNKWQGTAACQAAFVRSSWGSNATFLGPESATAVNMDIGAIVDFRSLGVIKPCLQELVTTGGLAQLAPLVKQSARSIIRLSLGKTGTAPNVACVANANTPAKFRYIAWCTYKADTSRSLAAAEDFQELVDTSVQPFPTRSQGGNDVIVDTTTYPVDATAKTYEYTVFGDFVDVASLKAWVTARDRFQLLHPGNPRRLMASCARMAMQIP